MSKREQRAVDPYDLIPDPRLADLVRTAIRNDRLGIRTHVPAAVKTYDPTTRRATVVVQTLEVQAVIDAASIPANVQSVRGTPPNAEAVMQPIELRGILVHTYRTSSGELTFPVNPGDTGTLHVCDRAMNAWMQTGIPSDPVMAWTHALQDSVFYPGLYPLTAVVQPNDQTATVLDGVAAVKIGANAVSPAAKFTELVAAMDAAIAAAVTAAGLITPPAGDGGSSAFAAFQLAWEMAKANIAATKAKVE